MRLGELRLTYIFRISPLLNLESSVVKKKWRQVHAYRLFLARMTLEKRRREEAAKGRGARRRQRKLREEAVLTPRSAFALPRQASQLVVP